MPVNKLASSISMRLPLSLSLSDLISIISVAVSITLAWAYFGARVTALEKEVMVIKQIRDKQDLRIDILGTKLGEVYITAHDDELYIDQLFKLIDHQQAHRRTHTDAPNYSTPTTPAKLLDK